MNMTERKTTRFRKLADRALSPRAKSHRARATLLAAALGVTATVSAAPTIPTGRPILASQTKPHKPSWFQVGRASWYGGSFNGRRTASGTRFNENELTAAHRTLPLGSWVRVTNLQNHRSTVVQITDRGPFVPHMMLDLSFAAAHRLGFSGLAKVRIERLAPEELAEARRTEQAAQHPQELAQVDLPRTPQSGQ
jgi:rare lipoprotein A